MDGLVPTAFRTLEMSVTKNQALKLATDTCLSVQYNTQMVTVYL